jgi:ferredoxin
VANPADKLPENAAGRYYVDTQCIDCDVCRVTAPENFRRDEEKAYSHVFRQPSTPEEEAQCQEAMDSCPVEAIGDNGEP